ncbi:glycosyl hydrolase-related protein [Paenibacillus sp.]|uniref:glycoside hydrolase family 38 N-terminal domain-containing protein n=1 Tax=Paenibacillus sp. TaxID=58172 RepID=UPI002D5CB09A|nr:glycosyl hydrolase-related protein [Paenibacillus sp.]HZG56105.1 glycosyl hydrolase-related protein [Paenibacillus sp.]
MNEPLWSIGSPDGKSPQLYDNYKEPCKLGDVVWLADEGRTADGGERWPMFHPSEADPDSGYRLHPYTIRFALERIAPAYVLRLHILTIAPRLSFLEISVNGVSGEVHLRAAPSSSGDIAIHSGLHTTIYADGVADVVIPGRLLRPGANELALVSRDGGETIRVERIEAIKRLDRMANAAGVLYKGIEFWEKEPPASPIARVDIRSTVVYKRGEDGRLYNECELFLELAQSMPDADLTLALTRANGETCNVPVRLVGLPFGHPRVTFALPDGEGDVSYALTGDVGGRPVSFSGSFRPRRKWTVYITPHAHTDIGYTHRQWEVAERLCRNIDTALDWIEAEERAGETSFTYHLDAGWAMETYLQTRSEARKAQLFRAIRSGRIGVAAHYVDLLTQYAGLEDLIRNGEFLNDALTPHELKSEFAAVVDVASLTGSLPAILEGSGVPYLVHADNQDRGPFRLNGGLHKVSPFYWEGTNGGRVLCWLAKMYCELRKVCGSPPTPSAAERGLDLWLAEYERDDYAPDAVLLYGQEADNTDIDPQPNDFVKRWNAEYAYPRLVPSDVTDFFRDVEARFGDKLQTFRGDGGAYWEDGVGSSMRETIAVREAQAALPAAERLETLAALHNGGWAYPLAHYDEAWRQVLLYDEHTWGAFLSGPEPDALLAQDQWDAKKQMADDAAQWGKRLLHVAAARHSLSWNNDGREVVVYNPHSFEAGGPVAVEIMPGEAAFDPETGARLPLRPLRVLATQAVVELWVDPMPGFSYRRFVLKPSEEGTALAAGSAVRLAAKPSTPVTLTNDWYQVTIDPERGCLTSWVDRSLGRELVLQSGEGEASYGFGQFIYAEGGEGTRLMGNQADLAEGRMNPRAEFSLTRATLQSSDVGRTLRLTGAVPYGELDIEWILYDRTKRLDVRYTYRKEERRRKEAAYIAFPTALADAAVRSDSQIGWVDWDRDQLPGGCKEWLPLQTSILLDAPGVSVQIASPDVPLFTIGEMVQGRWPREKSLRGGTVFSYVLNNYWHTNYKASQGGELRFGYSFVSGAERSEADAYRTGWTARRPLVGQRMSFQDFRETKPPYEAPSGGMLASFASDGLVVTTMKRARYADGYIVRAQNITGESAAGALSFPGKRIVRAWRTDLLERERSRIAPNGDGSLTIEAPAWGLATVRIELEERT